MKDLGKKSSGTNNKTNYFDKMIMQILDLGHKKRNYTSSKKCSDVQNTHISCK